MPSDFLFGLLKPCTLTAGQSFHSQLVPLVVFEQILRSSIKRLDHTDLTNPKCWTFVRWLRERCDMFWQCSYLCSGARKRSDKGLFCCTSRVCTSSLFEDKKIRTAALEIADLLPVNKWKMGSPLGSQKEGKKEKVWFVSTTRIHC